MNKLLLLVGCVMLPIPGTLSAQMDAPQKKLDQAKGLSEAGNHREAADVLLPLLKKDFVVSGDLRAKALADLSMALDRLGEDGE